MTSENRDEELRAIRQALSSLREQLSETEARLAKIEAGARDEAPTLPKMSVPDSPARVVPVSSQPLPPPPPPPPPPLMKKKSPPPKVAKEKKPAATRQDWEKWIGTYLAPRLGALFVVTAGVLLLSMAANQLGAAGRVGIGYGASGLLLGLGFWQERRYLQFGRVLIGAGFSLAYFVSYAAHYISFARVFDSKPTAWVLMTGVIALWAGVALWRKSTIMASVVVVLGHFTIFLTGPAAESVLAIVMISVGCAFMMARNRWTVVAALGVGLSYLNYFLWLANSEGSGTLGEFYMAMSFLAANFAAFALGDFLGPRPDSENRIDTRARSGILSANSALFLGLGAFLVQHGPFDDPPFDVFFLMASLPLLVLGAGHLRTRGVDPVFNLYLTKGVAVATLGIALYVDRDARTAAWAIEAAVLWMSARRSGLLVTRALALAVGALTLASAFGAWNGHPQVLYHDLDSPGRIAAGVIAWMAWWVAAWLGEKTDWESRSPRSIPVLALFQGPLYAFGFVTEPVKNGVAVDPKNSMRIFFGAGGGLFTALVLMTVFAARDMYLVAAGSVIVLAMIAGAAAMRSADLASILLTLFALAAVFYRYIIVAGGDGILGVLALAAVFASVLFGEKRFTGDRMGWFYRGHDYVIPYLYIAVALMGMMVAVDVLRTDMLPLALVVFAYASAGATVALNRNGLKASSILILFATLMAHIDAHRTGNDVMRHLSAWAIMVFPVVTQAYYLRMGVHGRSIATNFAYVPAAFCAVVSYVPYLISEPWLPVGWAVVAVALFGLGAWHRIPVAIIAGALTLVLASMVAIFHSSESDQEALPHVFSFVAVIVVWIGMDRFFARADEGSFYSKLAHMPMAVAAVLSVLLFAMYPGITAETVAIGWTLLALAWFGISLPLRDSYYRYAGIVVFALAIGRVAMIVLSSDMATIYKVAAAFVLGVVLLAVGWGYYKAQAILEPEKRESEAEATDE